MEAAKLAFSEFLLSHCLRTLGFRRTRCPRNPSPHSSPPGSHATYPRSPSSHSSLYSSSHPLLSLSLRGASPQSLATVLSRSCNVTSSLDLHFTMPPCDVQSDAAALCRTTLSSLYTRHSRSHCVLLLSLTTH